MQIAVHRVVVAEHDGEVAGGIDLLDVSPAGRCVQLVPGGEHRPCRMACQPPIVCPSSGSVGLPLPIRLHRFGMMIHNTMYAISPAPTNPKMTKISRTRKRLTPNRSASAAHTPAMILPSPRLGRTSCFFLFLAIGAPSVRIDRPRPYPHAGVATQYHAVPGDSSRAAYTPDGATLVSVSSDKTVRVWDVAAVAPRHTMTGHRDAVVALDVSPDGKSAATAGYDGRVLRWDLAAGTCVADHESPLKRVAALVHTPDGTRALESGQGPLVVVRDAATGAQTRAIDTGAPGVTGLASSPDGQLVVTGGYDGIARYGAPTRPNGFELSTWVRRSAPSRCPAPAS